MNSRIRFLALLLGLITAGAAGCGGSKAPTGADAATAQASMRWLGLMYSRYIVAHNGQPPKDEASFRTFLETQMQELNQFGVKSADVLFQTSRDGEPLVVVYGKKVSAPDTPELCIAAYEKTGVGEKRLACNTRGGVFELDPEQFALQVPQQ
jgi:hypothetical protein